MMMIRLTVLAMALNQDIRMKEGLGVERVSTGQKEGGLALQETLVRARRMISIYLKPAG